MKRAAFVPVDHADLCRHGHGPMWWWPTGGTWACSNVQCGQTQPVTQRDVIDLHAARMMAPDSDVYRFTFRSTFTTNDPRTLFTIRTVQ